MQFKPGDQVRIRDEAVDNVCAHCNDQRTVTVTDFDPDSTYEVSFECADGSTCSEKARNFELVKPGKENSMAFSTGDLVRITGPDVDGDDNEYYPIGHVGSITHVSGDEYEVDDAYYYPASSLVKVNSEGNLEMNVDATTALNNVNLDADSRLLRQHGLEDNYGKSTSNGREIMITRLWNENREAIAKDLRKSLKAEKDAAEATK